jgi:uncharacterized membrane protein YfcA
VMLIAVALRILVRFSRSDRTAVLGDTPQDIDARGVGAAGFAGGITNGLIGAWGPVVTPVLLHKGLAARFTVGSVNAAEVAVAVVSVGSLATSMRGGGIDVGILIAMLVGGVLAAPIAAALVRRLPKHGMGVAVAGLLLLTNVRELANWYGLGPIRWIAYGAVLTAVALAWSRPRWTRPERTVAAPAVDVAAG